MLAGLPPKQGLYDPQFEHDSCGVGFVVDVRGRKSAIPDGAGNVVTSTTRNRSRVMLPPVLLTMVRRMSNVPKVELFGGSLVKSRTRFGGLAGATHISNRLTAKLAFLSIGLERFSGPGAPKR